MPRPRSRLALLLAAVAPLGVSCSSSATDPGRNAGTPALSASEAGTVASGLLTQASTAVTGRGTGTLNSDGSYTYTSQCPGGGTISSVTALGSTTTNADGSVTYSGTMTLTPRACVVGTGTRQISITGDPSEVTRSSITLSGTTLVKSVSTVTGGFRWDGGSCQLNYTATIGVSGSTRTITVAGTVCGQSVNRTSTF